MANAASNRHNAQRRIMVLQKWPDGSVILNCDFEDTNVTPESLAYSIASGRYSSDAVHEVYECWPGEGGRDITRDVYEAAERLARNTHDPYGDLVQLGLDKERDRRAMGAL
jgi:hypothetical protein